MESNFQDVMREEIYSKKMGRLEDLEDMRMEEEELKRKAMRKKRKIWSGCRFSGPPVAISEILVKLPVIAAFRSPA